ncbi:acyltransferase family protein [Hydrogenophaga sp. BPS33]|uniref:acyltransferase family protein n=1 Tax=Hydrogenophaga sp. BPS33 TaxID=2651974 RepID=UPI001F26F67B|nr:acyltransferase [Hydrogenophaga sp. BPS33]
MSTYPLRGAAERLLFIDLLKAVGAQLIVLHHLAFYGPMSDWTHRLAPDLVSWFSQDARMAVQIFLVVAGFLAARSMAPGAVPRNTPFMAQLGQRYVRTALPYIAALVVAMLCTELARRWMAHDSVSPPPGLWQFLSHALLLHTLLDMDSLSAGVWYVAIDFQLYALLLAVLWLSRRLPASSAWAMAFTALLVAASLFHFNTDSDWDSWALYFSGAYGLGALAYWTTHDDEAWRNGRWLMGALVAMALMALTIDFRERIALALMVCLALACAQRQGWLFTWPRSRVVAYLSRISYAVFLLNFSVALVVNAWFTRYGSHDSVTQTGGVLLAWLACNVAGALFYRWVEQPLGRLKLRRKPAAVLPLGSQKV